MASSPSESGYAENTTQAGGVPTTPPPGRVDLSSFSARWYHPGRGILIRTAWYFVNAIIFVSPLVPLYGLQRTLLRLFGATVGHGVVIKPRVNIKYPWRVTIGDNVWIGEGVWLDSLADIRIGANCCISQEAYLCTGNHDWSRPSFDLIIKPIDMEEGSWIGARAIVLGGATMRSHAILTAGSVLGGDTEPYTIYQGTPAVAIKQRIVGKKPEEASGYRLVYSQDNKPMRQAN